MRKRVIVFNILIIVSVIVLSSCDLSVDGVDDKNIYRYIIDGTADSVRFKSPKTDEIRYKNEYPVLYDYVRYSDIHTELIRISNLCDTGYIYVAIIVDPATNIDTTYDTINPNEVHGY